jgi:hypothetical protein
LPDGQSAQSNLAGEFKIINASDRKPEHENWTGNPDLPALVEGLLLKYERAKASFPARWVTLAARGLERHAFRPNMRGNGKAAEAPQKRPGGTRTSSWPSGRARVK